MDQNTGVRVSVLAGLSALGTNLMEAMPVVRVALTDTNVGIQRLASRICSELQVAVPEASTDMHAR